MSFHEVRFPAALSFGSIGGPERRTDVVTLANGHEERNSPWMHSKRRYDAGFGMRSLEDVEALIAFFEARRGQMYGFRWKDWSDFKSASAGAAPGAEDQLLALGDGATQRFDLIKSYRSGTFSYDRPIRKPVEGTVLVAVDGAVQAAGSAYTLDPATGEITFGVAPAMGARVTAGFEFDVPVRFDTDTIQTSVASFKAGQVPNVPVIEVRV